MSAVSVGQSTISAQLSDTEITQGQFCAPVPICPTARPVIPTDGTTVRVEVPTADIVGDIIAVSLAPTDLSGTLAVIAQGPSVNKTIFNGTQSGGTPTFSFNRTSLPVGSYTSVNATWNSTQPGPAHVRPFDGVT